MEVYGIQATTLAHTFPPAQGARSFTAWKMELSILPAPSLGLWFDPGKGKQLALPNSQFCVAEHQLQAVEAKRTGSPIAA